MPSTLKKSLTQTKALLLVVAMAALSGCQPVQTPDGTVPDAYLAQAKTLEGDYRGSFEKRGGVLRVAFDGNRPVVTFMGDDGSSDLINPSCESKIGRLGSISVSGNQNQVKVANFYFDPALCAEAIDGRNLRLEVSSQGGQLTVKASIVKYMSSPGGCDYPNGGSCEPHAISYLRGSFTRTL